MKYTREDVIITREQAEKAGLKTGSECYFGNKPSEAIINANNDCLGHLYGIDWRCGHPFHEGVHGIYHWDCVILKKEPKKKLVPFDLSLEEDRKELRGRWIRAKSGDAAGTETTIISFLRSEDNYWTAQYIMGMHHFSTIAYGLFEDFVFVDTGRPVGKEVDE